MIGKSGLNIDIESIRNAVLNFLVPLVCLSVSVLLFFVIIYPSINSLSDLQAELDKKYALDDQLQTKLRNLNKLLDFKSVISEDSVLVEKVLKSESQIPQLLTQVDQIARASNLKVTRLSYSFSEGTESDTSGTTYSVVTVALGATGSYTNLIEFLTNLENSARLVNVDTFRFSTETTIEGNKFLSVLFVLKSPYLFVKSNAVTDDPVNIDVSDQVFLRFIDAVKKLKFYNIQVNPTVVEGAKESTSSGTR